LGKGTQLDIAVTGRPAIETRYGIVAYPKL
jgi:hypothetical protein